MCIGWLHDLAGNGSGSSSSSSSNSQNSQGGVSPSSVATVFFNTPLNQGNGPTARRQSSAATGLYLHWFIFYLL